MVLVSQYILNHNRGFEMIVGTGSNGWWWRFLKMSVKLYSILVSKAGLDSTVGHILTAEGLGLRQRARDCGMVLLAKDVCGCRGFMESSLPLLQLKANVYQASVVGFMGVVAPPFLTHTLCQSRATGSDPAG